MRHITPIAAALVMVLVGAEPTRGQQASLELVARFDHYTNGQSRNEFCLDGGSYVVAAKSWFTEFGSGGVQVFLQPLSEPPDTSKRAMWLYVSGADDDYAYETFTLRGSRCVTVTSTFAYGRIYRLIMETAAWPERGGNRPPYPPPPPPLQPPR